MESDHNVLHSDVKFNALGCLVAIRSSKTERKGDHVRYIPVVESPQKEICAVNLLKELIVKFNVKADQPLFCLLGGEPVSYSRFSRKFKLLLGDAGIQGNYASHSLRRGGLTSSPGGIGNPIVCIDTSGNQFLKKSGLIQNL